MVTALAAAEPDSVQGAPVSVMGFLSHQVTVEKGTGESANCHLLEDDEVDWHIYLTKSANQAISKAVIVETTPRTRPLHHWNKSVLDNVLNRNVQVRVSGWLMYDWQHKGAVGTQRATVGKSIQSPELKFRRQAGGRILKSRNAKRRADGVPEMWKSVAG